MYKNKINRLLTVFVMLLVGLGSTIQANVKEPAIKKILIIGDSMTGWLSERINAWGKTDGFSVSTVVWDGSTMKKWADSPRFATIIKEQKPDCIFICLGMNEMASTNPASQFGNTLEKFMKVIGETPYLWIGPPTWPGKNWGAAYNDWMSRTLGEEHYYNSSSLNLARQSSTNPHPTRVGMCTWADAVMRWIPSHTDLNFPKLNEPRAGEMIRPATFIYKKMKQSL